MFFSQQLKANGFAEQLIETMRESNTGILRLPMNMEGVRRAMQGDTGTVIAPNTTGRAISASLHAARYPGSQLGASSRRSIRTKSWRRRSSFQRNLMILACALALGNDTCRHGSRLAFLAPGEKR